MLIPELLSSRALNFNSVFTTILLRLFVVAVLCECLTETQYMVLLYLMSVINFDLVRTDKYNENGTLTNNSY